MSKLLDILNSEKPKTTTSLVISLLRNSEEELEKANRKIKSLNEDLNAFHNDIEEIKKYVKVELSANKTEFKIVIHKDPENDWNTDTISWSGSLKENEFKSDFKFLMKLFHLELPDVDIKED